MRPHFTNAQERVDLDGIREIEHERAPGLRQCRGDGARLVDVPRGDDHVEAIAREPFGHRFADVGRRASDECDLVHAYFIGRAAE
jgi:hypothetical protein